MSLRIPVAEPALVGNEKDYVLDCLESGWISSNGKYIQEFERAFARFCGTKHAISCCNGTVALHLALLALGVGPGDEVIVPTLTFVASANSVVYCGAKPVFVDSEPNTWTLDPSQLEHCITSNTKGIIVVHLYGHPADMDRVNAIARKYGLFVIEDAAEAHGAEYKGQRVGSLGDVATFSFYGNKIITTGEGGMITTDNDELAARLSLLKGQGMDRERRYWFIQTGYNYRMTNLEAALGLAQLERIDWHSQRRREVAAQYVRFLTNIPGIKIQIEQPWARHAYWMNSVIIDEEDWPIERDHVMMRLADAGIETRPVFYPMHALPMYLRIASECCFPVADRLSARGINLPSSARLTEEDVRLITAELARILETGP